MLVKLTNDAALLVLGALRHVATPGGSRYLTATDRRTLDAFDRLVLRRDTACDLDGLPDPSPTELAAALQSHDVRTHVVQFLVVMALVDGVIDKGKIPIVIDYAKALEVKEDAVRQLAELGRGNLAWVRADVQRQNLLSITGQQLEASVDEWILPYRGDHADPKLAGRYRALGKLPSGTLGYTFFKFYQTNRFPFPGEPQGLNERFASRHDTTHILSGYDTSPQGELLVSTFTAGMHPQEPMSGHILPVIMSWHMGIELVHLAGSSTGQLDPEKFWFAWERGSDVTTDVFADTWDLWAVAAQPLDNLRAAYHVPPLDSAHAADGRVRPWYHPVA
jgi:hypothetical protein